ncbi:MAG TPA: DUF1376 domain-containing protein [Alphaproteobacteria bacterium]|nr:DUF1376 domain-containing protein [Alphaproteobacteria bacterium]
MSGSRADTWMPLYWGDYHRDTGHLSAAEHGAYLMLLGHYWTTGAPPADDNAQLARIARMTPQEWRKARATIAAFFDVKNGAWTHGRVEHELARAKAKMERRSKAGKRGAEVRWQPDGIAPGNRIGSAPPGHRQTDGPSPSQSQEPLSERSLSSNTDHSEIKESGVLQMARGRHGRVDYSDPTNRNAYADKKVAEVLASRTNEPEAWMTIFAARDPKDPNHEKARRECELIARSISVTWDAARGAA